jgi:UDP-glucose pyrophosphorylase
MKITKAVIPAAGLGTRVLPASKAVPKEMLMIVDKPAIQYIVEEAVASGITDILIITSRGKSVMEDHFDRSPELERRLEDGNKLEILETVKKISSLANISFIRQPEQKGLGHAMMYAKSFAAGEPFAVLYGDDVIIDKPGFSPVTKQLCDAYEEYGKGAVGIKEVSLEAIQKYSSMKTAPLRDNIYAIDDMIEKPSAEEVFSLYSILGRCVLPPEIFEILENTAPGAGGEIQLTDAMKTLSNTKGMVGVDFVGTRYDMGNKLGILQAIVEVGLTHPEVGAGFKEYLKTVKL